MNRIYIVLLSIIPVLYIIMEVRKKQFSIKESFWWMVAAIAILLLAIFPHSIDHIANIVGINYAPSLLFALCIMFLVLMNFRNSKKICEQQMKIIELAQNLSILKEEVERKNK